MKLSLLTLSLVAGIVSAFSPMSTQQKPFGVVVTRMSEEPSFTEPVGSGDIGGKLVPVKEETVEFTAGILGGVTGFAIGGPVLGALGAAVANYVAKNAESEVGTVLTAVSKSSIQVYNYLTTLDGKYEILNKAQGKLEEALGKLKTQDSVDEETVAKVETALASTKDKIVEINNEYDLVGSSVTALGVVGDLVEKAIQKAGELNEEYKLTDKAQDALSNAVNKAKEAAKEAVP